MASGIRPKSLVYKIGTFEEDKGYTLQSLLRQAYQKSKDALARAEPLDDKSDDISSDLKKNEGRKFRLINEIADNNGVLVGRFVDFTGGFHQPTITFESDKKTLEIKDREPGKNREFIEKPLYYLIKDNHVIMSQSTSLKSKQFEDHLRWLLLFKFKLGGDGQNLYLEDQPPPEKEKELRHVKKIAFHDHVESALTNASGGKPFENVGSERMSFAGSSFFAGLKSLLGEPKALDRIPAEALTKGNLRLSLELVWNHSDQDVPNAFMDGLGNALRNVDDVDYTIQLNSGAKIGSKDVKLSKTVRVEHDANGAPLRTELYAEMIDWLSDLVESKRVLE